MSSATEETTSSVSQRKHLSVLALLACIAVIIFVSDQLTKNWVVAELTEGRSVEVLGEFLQWHFVRNPGAAFSFATGATWVFTLLSAVVVGVIIWFSRKLGSVLWAIFLGLLLGGVLGNLTDRLVREPGFPVGHVIDFISTPWMMPAIYNIADIGIVGGMILFVILSLCGVHADGSARRSPAAQPEPTDSGAEESTSGDVPGDGERSSGEA